MATQTNWHLDALVLPEGDPMAEIDQLKSEAERIELMRTEDEVLAEFTAAVKREAGLADYGGVECDIKFAAMGRPPCYECPHYVDITRTDNPLGLVCQVGRRQVDLLDELEAIRAPARLDNELAAAFEREQAACEELAAAVL